MQRIHTINNRARNAALAVVVFTCMLCCSTVFVAATPNIAPTPQPAKTKTEGSYSLGPSNTKYACGGGNGAIAVSVDIGCVGKGNAILDFAFAIIRFLSYGAGLAIIASLVVGGIQFTISRGDPQATAAAINRVRNVVLALALYVFLYAIINYLVPGQLLK